MIKKGVSQSGILLIIVGVIWILSDFSVLYLEDWEWLLKYWSILLIVAGVGLVYYGKKAKNVSVLLLIIAFFAATLHHGIKIYDSNWGDYEYENDWDIFL